jgi:RHS repeat-associated protein
VHYAYEQHENFHNGPQLTSFTDANGQITHYEYQGTRLVKITTPRGEVTKIAYKGDKVETIIETTNSEHTTGPTWKFTYYEIGKAPAPCTSSQQATVVEDPDGTHGEAGHKTTYCANIADQVEKTIDANGNETATSYDAFGNVSATTAPARETGDSRGVTSFVYGTNGQNLLCEVQGMTSAVTECPEKLLEKGYATEAKYKDTTYLYQPTETLSALRDTTRLCYYGGTKCAEKEKEGATGAEGALKQETEPGEAKSTTYDSYEKDGNLSSSTDFDGHTTSYEYDASGNLKTIIPPTGSGLGKETITVDADSRPHIIVQCLAESSCTSSDTTTLTYDPLDRITEAVYTGPGATKTIKYTYNADDGLEKMVDPTGTTTYTLDPLGRVTEEALPGGVSNAYSYDEASNLLSLTDAGGTTHYFYNGLNELESMYEPGGSCTGTPSKCTQFAYDNDGSLTKTTYPSGASMRYKLDPTTGRILTAEADGTKGETLLSNTYSYFTSINDSPLIFKDTFSEPGVATSESDYSYDALNRLIYAVRDATVGGQPLACYKYEYDGDGNRTHTKTGLTEGCKEEKSVQYHNNTGNELECRITSGETCTNNKETEYSGYKYDGAGNETKITEYAEAGNTSFAFNNLSQLEGLTPPGKAEEKLKYLGSGQGKLTGLGTTTLQNSALGITKQTIEGNASYYARTPHGTLIDERLPGGTNYNPIYDAQGDVVGLLNSTGTLVQTVRYGGPYGENTNTSGTVAYSTTNDPFLFQGGYHLAGGNAGTGNVPNGLYHFGARYYDPTSGRWTQPDPASGMTNFTFVGDDPINDNDPAGESVVSFLEDGAEELYEAGKLTVKELKEVHEGHYTHALELLERAKPVYDCVDEAENWLRSFGPAPKALTALVATGGCIYGAAPK